MAPTRTATKPAQAQRCTTNAFTANAADPRSAPRIMRGSAMQDLSTFQGPNRGIATYIHHPKEDSLDSSDDASPARGVDEYDAVQLSQLTTVKQRSGSDLASPKTPRSGVRTTREISAHQPNQLRSSKVAYDDLNAHYVAAERQRQTDLVAATESHNRLMSSLMTVKLLAEAESQELYARRLRENVARIDQSYDGEGMLRLTAIASTAVMQQKYDETVDSSAGPGPHEADTHSIASEDTINADVRSPQLKDSPIERHHLQDRASVSDDGGSEQLRSVSEAQWQPHAIAELAPVVITTPNDRTFTWEDLHRHLGGAQYSPGLYFARNESKSRVLKDRTYWLLEGQYEPFVPTSPGQHGAKLTAFFNDSPTTDGDFLEEEDYTDVPLFVCLNQREGYTYLGQYSQKRYSDRHSHSELFQHVPAHVLRYWAAQLADPARPAWITEKLIEHFWPAPPYTGAIPSDSAVTTPGTGVTAPHDPERVLEKRVQRSLERHALKLRDWKKDAAIKATLLNEQAIMEMWNKSDMDEEPGLRLWWEYLECVGFDEKFYDKLVSLKNQKPVSAPSKMAKTKDSKVEQQAIRSGHQQYLPPARRSSIPASNSNKKERHDSVSTLEALQDYKSVLKESPPNNLSGWPEDTTMPLAPIAWRKFPQADLQAAREMQDSATKAGERRRGRSEKARKW